jgi:hypothetical protein
VGSDSLAAALDIGCHDFYIPAVLNRVGSPICDDEWGVAPADRLAPKERKSAGRPIDEDFHFIVTAIAMETSKVSPERPRQCRRFCCGGTLRRGLEVHFREFLPCLNFLFGIGGR